MKPETQGVFIAKILLGLLGRILILLALAHVLSIWHRWHMNRSERGISDERLREISGPIRLFPLMLLGAMVFLAKVPISKSLTDFVLPQLVWIFFFATGFACFMAGEEKCRASDTTWGYLFFANGIAVILMGILFLLVMM